MLAAARKKDDNATMIAAAGRFGNFRPESEQQVRKAEIKDDPILGRLVSAWRSFNCPLGFNCQAYETAYKSLKSIDFDSNAIERFSLALEAFQGMDDFPSKAGFFLSVLVNCGKDSDYIIHTSHLDEQINWLGYRNTKNIIVKGDVDLYLGYEMKRGSIYVDGDAWGEAGIRMRDGFISINGRAGYDVGLKMSGGKISVRGDGGERIGREITGGVIEIFGNGGDHTGQMMKGGTITVRGDTRFEVGNWMEGGLIVVTGNAGETVGEGMSGGRIYLLGEYSGLSTNITGGKIFHDGRFIVDK
jgi:formylmethanofuran dehydrogenase subunit C